MRVKEEEKKDASKPGKELFMDDSQSFSKWE
jgi:hypothetical protein